MDHMTDAPCITPFSDAGLIAGADNEIESPRMEYLFGQLRIALSIAKAGIRADGLLDTDLMLRITFDNDQIAIEGIGEVAGTRIMGWIKASLVDQGFAVDDHENKPALIVY